MPKTSLDQSFRGVMAVGWEEFVHRLRSEQLSHMLVEISVFDTQGLRQEGKLREVRLIGPRVAELPASAIEVRFGDGRKRFTVHLSIVGAVLPVRFLDGLYGFVAEGQECLCTIL